METEPFFLDSNYADSFAEDGSFDRKQLKISTLNIFPYRLGCFLFTVVPIIVFAIFATQLFPYLATVREDRAYEREGIAVDLTVLDCAMDGPRSGAKRPYVHYTYTVANERYEGTQVMDKQDNCDSYPDNSIFEGQYLSGDPQSSRFTRHLPASDLGHNGFKIFLSVLGFVYIIVLIYLARHYIKTHKRYNRLIATGRVLDGEIIEVTGGYGARLSLYAKESNYYVRVFYAFETPLAQPVNGVHGQKRNDLKDKKLPRKGTPVKVLYADDDAFVLL